MCVLSRPLKALRVMGEPLSVLCTYVRTFFSLIMEERGEGRGVFFLYLGRPYGPTYAR